MSYTINNTRGSVVTTVTPGTTQVVGGITLIGKNYTGYGELIAEDFVKILENQATNGSAPSTPLTGQLWYDITDGTLKVYNSTAWARVGTQVSTSAPASPQAGDQWFDNTDVTATPSKATGTLKIYNGHNWISTAMASSKTRSEAVAVNVGNNSWATTARKNGFTSNSNVSVDVTAIVATDGAGNEEVVAVYSPASFDIKTTTPNYNVAGTLVKDIYDNFSSSTTGASSTGSLQAGLNIRDGFLDPAATAPLSDETLALQDAGNSAVNYDSTKIMILTKTSAQEHAGDITPNANSSINLGSNTKRYANIYGVSTSAKYGDLAERYSADSVMDAGTVVALGGVEEITKTAERADENVFGVISDKPAFRMNDGGEDDSTNPFVAFSGRVPCKVKGPVAKGDRLVSSDIPGVAIKASETDGWKSTFGRALESKTTEDIKKITIAIGVK